jgi:ribosomal protein L4
VAQLVLKIANGHLKQVIDRVVLTYTKAGKEHGYFATDKDAEIFEHELTHMLLHQIFLIQLTSLVQRWNSTTTAGISMLHPVS